MNLPHVLKTIVDNPEIHCKWLNTLSMMENTGARKISASEHPVKVNLIILKHAAEEARHAYYLKKQISKINEHACPDYNFASLIAPIDAYQYLHKLDVEVCRFLKEKGTKPEDIKYLAYLLVTYAIEVRADELYPIYQDALDSIKSRVNVKSIIAEEVGHLEEMINQLQHAFDNWEEIAAVACEIEQKLFENFMQKVQVNISVEA